MQTTNKACATSAMRSRARLSRLEVVTGAGEGEGRGRVKSLPPSDWKPTVPSYFCVREFWGEGYPLAGLAGEKKSRNQYDRNTWTAAEACRAPVT